MRPLKTPKQSPKHQIILYDFETTLGPLTENAQKHVVNYANCQFTCDECLDMEILPNNCTNCGSINKSWSKLEGKYLLIIDL